MYAITNQTPSISQVYFFYLLRVILISFFGHKTSSLKSNHLTSDEVDGWNIMTEEDSVETAESKDPTHVSLCISLKHD